VPDRSFLSIGDVLGLLRDEFPDVTISKIRFLESKGLLCPERTPSGYRKFYPRDVNTLRWVLYLQREEYLPLRVIRSRLQVLDLDQPPPISNGAATAPAGLPFPPNPAVRPEAGVSSSETVPTPRGNEVGREGAEPSVVGPSEFWATDSQSTDSQSAELQARDPASPEGGPASVAPLEQPSGVRWPTGESRLGRRDPQAGRTSTAGATVRWIPTAGAPAPATRAEVSPTSGWHEPDVEGETERSPAVPLANRHRGEPEATGPRRVAPSALPAAMSAPSAVALRLLTNRGGRANDRPVGEPPMGGDPHDEGGKDAPAGQDRHEGGGLSGGAEGGEPAVRGERRAGPEPVRGPESTPDSETASAGSGPLATPLRPGSPSGAAEAGRARDAPNGADETVERGPSSAEGSSVLAEERRWTRRELAEEVGVSERALEELARFGFLHGRTAFGEVFFDALDRQIATAAAHFLRLGLEPRHLRLYQNAVAREASLLEQVVTPLLRQRNPEARARAAAVLDELGHAGGALRSALLTAALRELREL